MVASSVSTYLDIAQAASGATRASDVNNIDQAETNRAAKVVAAIHAGTEIAKELPDKTGLPFPEVLTALAWLSSKGLVELDEGDGGLRAKLSEPVKAALDSSV
jgi:predicted transcriptional regulator